MVFVNAGIILDHFQTRGNGTKGITERERENRVCQTYDGQVDVSKMR